MQDVTSDPLSHDSCILCCRFAPPFEVTVDGGSAWLRIPLAQTRMMEGDAGEGWVQLELTPPPLLLGYASGRYDL